MSNATLDRVLALLVAAMVGTGLLALKAGGPSSAWIFALHGLVGGALLAATIWKLRRSVPRAVGAGRWPRLTLATLVALLAVGALTGGFLWVASGELLAVGSVTVMTVHAWLGLILVPVVVVHLLPRRWRVVPLPARSGISRRTLLASGGLALAGLAAFSGAAILDQLRGGVRRFTGSRWLPSGGVPPPTTFYGEGAPAIDPDGWRLAVNHALLSLADIRAIGETDRTVVLDCTSGWAMETAWWGVPLLDVFAAAGVAVPIPSSIRVRSVTGWSTLLTNEEARDALLATGVAGEPLPAANGAPCRLVVPDRRGLDWVKWVNEVSLA